MVHIFDWVDFTNKERLEKKAYVLRPSPYPQRFNTSKANVE
jgi:hypothetical protein